MQLKDGLGVDVGLAGAGLHLNGELIAGQIVGLGQIIPPLDRPHVGQQGRGADLQGVSNAVLRLHGCLAAAALQVKGGGGPPLPLKEGTDRVNGGGLKVLMLEFEFHSVLLFSTGLMNKRKVDKPMGTVTPLDLSTDHGAAGGIRTHVGLLPN